MVWLGPHTGAAGPGPGLLAQPSSWKSPEKGLWSQQSPHASTCVAWPWGRSQPWCWDLVYLSNRPSIAGSVSNLPDWTFPPRPKEAAH